MRLLLFSDLHADIYAARQLVKRARTFSVDLLVGAGDFGNARSDVDVCMETLRSSGLPAVFVPGNNESREELIEACRDYPQAQVLHGTGCRIQGVDFFGLGGGVPATPFGAWSYDFSEEQAAELLQDAPPGCVLITHSPPHGTVDVSSRGASLGSTAVRDAVLRLHPALVVCGHIHASAGQQAVLEGTPVVNAGPYGVKWPLATTPTPQEG